MSKVLTNDERCTAVPIKLVVMDMAGTTVDEHGLVRESVIKAIESTTGGELAENFDTVFGRTRGGAKTAMFQALLGDPGLARQAHAAFENYLETYIRAGRVTPIPGATEAFDILRQHGIKVALATGFSGRVREALLESLGWGRRVDLVLSPEDAGRGRPYPDTVLTAVIGLEIDSVQQVAVVGDTVNDLRCGTNAGAAIVAAVLTGAHDRDILESTPHTHILDSVADLPDIVLAHGSSSVLA